MNTEDLTPTDQQQFYLDGFSRLIAGLREDNDDAVMFEYLQEGLKTNPQLLLSIIEGSIQKAEVALGQQRRSGSSATLYYPIEAAIKYLAKRRGFFFDGRDPLTSSSWSLPEMMNFLEGFQTEIIDIAGSKTTSKNLPQRAVQMMWLLDQVPRIKPSTNFAFIELGASNGLILDAFRQPSQFKKWYAKQPSAQLSQRIPFGEKLVRPQYPTLGLDIAAPDMDWNFANILDEGIRKEIRDFISTFPTRSNVVIQDARNIRQIPEVTNLMTDSYPSIPVVISCFMLYQVPQPARYELQRSVREFLKSQGGGFFIKTDIAKYMGRPEMAGGALSWIENEDETVISPTILLRGKTISQWDIITEDL